MLEDVADEAASAGIPGASRISMRDAWSIRLHGAGERLSLTVASRLALTALVASTLASALWFVALTRTPWGDSASLIVSIVTIAVAPALLSPAVAAVLRHTGTLSAPAAVGVALFAPVAWVLGMLAMLAWTTGFTEADAGLPRSPFGELFIPLALTSWLVATGVSAPIFAGLLSSIRNRRTRQAGAIVLAATCVIPAGLSVAAPATGLVSAIIVSIIILVAVPRLTRGRSGTAATSSGSGAATSVYASTTRVRTPMRILQRRTIIGLAGVSAVIGLGCVAFALSGSHWRLESLGMLAAVDGTQAMNAGLAVGAIAAVPFVLGAGIAMASLHGRWVWFIAGSIIVCLGFGAAAQALGAGHDAQWPLVVAGSVWVGVACAVLIGRVLQVGAIGAVGRAAISIGCGIAASAAFGAVTVMLLPFVAPCGAVWLIIWSLRAPRLEHPSVQLAS
ncbi:hypothetical protein ACL9RL_08075 [Plantibacter sp. Mn2098]|uniref:hypothetical protein n=1 Tax=Plantibacter sp. Mn2098 TaxID=3395266 RepID=UPI003BDFAD6E